MCLAIPSKVVEINEELNIAKVDTMGVLREASLDLLPEPVEIGDYVLIHIGYAMNKIDKDDALETLKIYKEILQKMDEEESLEEESQKQCS